MYDILGLEFLCDCFVEKLSFENLCARPVLYEGHTLMLHVDEERKMGLSVCAFSVSAGNFILICYM